MALSHHLESVGLPGGVPAPLETASDVPSHGDADAPLISLLAAYRQVALAAGMEPQQVESLAAEVFPERAALRGHTGSTVLSLTLEAVEDHALPALLVKIASLPGANREALTAQQANLEQLPLCQHTAHVDIVDAYNASAPPYRWEGKDAFAARVLAARRSRPAGTTVGRRLREGSRRLREGSRWPGPSSSPFGPSFGTKTPLKHRLTILNSTVYQSLLWSGPGKGVITKGVFSLEESLESLKSLDSLESLENGGILLCFPQSGRSLESLESLNSLESLENRLF